MSTAWASRAPELDGLGHRRGEGRGGQGAVREQHLDQRPGAGRVAVLAAGGVPVPLVGGGEGPGRPGLGQRGRAGQRAGLARQDFQVMVQEQDLGVLAGRPLMPGHDPRPVEHLHAAGRQPHRQPAAGVAGRDGVVVLPHADPGPAVHPGLQQPRRVERLGGQRPHGGLLVGERRGDR